MPVSFEQVVGGEVSLFTLFDSPSLTVEQLAEYFDRSLEQIFEGLHYMEDKEVLVVDDQCIITENF